MSASADLRGSGGRRLGWAVAMFTALTLVAASTASGSGGHSLAIVSPKELSLSPGDKTKTLVARNDGPKVGTVNFFASPKGRIVVKPARTAGIDADGVKSFDLTFKPKSKGKKFKGILVVTAKGVAPGTVALAYTPTSKAPEWLYAVIFGPLFGALGFILLRGATLQRIKYTVKRGEHTHTVTVKLGDRLGPGNWDFTKSWASNLTVIGALLGTILAAGALPTETAVDKATYAGLNLFFGLLILIAPFFYLAFQRAKVVQRRMTPKEPQYQGYVWSFLASAWLTLWAVAGELVTVTLLFDKIRTERSLPDKAVWVMWAVVGAAGFGLVFYSWRSIEAIVKNQSIPDLRSRKRRPRSMLYAFGYTDRLDGEEVPSPDAPERYLPPVAPL